MEAMDTSPLIVGNWKMELSHKAELEMARALKSLLKGTPLTAQVVICPSFPTLPLLHEFLGTSEKLELGAQTIHWEEKGAWTGAVSVLQISPWAKWVIVGHSEQRELTGCTDVEVEKQAQLALKHGLTPIICIGETAEERAADQTIARVTEQVSFILQKMTRASITRIVIAYEPLWAIGTGNTPDPNDIAATLLLIRKLIAERFDRPASERIRLLYGGSVTPDTVDGFMSEPGVNGVLVGGSSVHPMEFVEIIKNVSSHAG